MQRCKCSQNLNRSFPTCKHHKQIHGKFAKMIKRDVAPSISSTLFAMAFLISWLGGLRLKTLSFEVCRYYWVGLCNDVPACSGYYSGLWLSDWHLNQSAYSPRRLCQPRPESVPIGWLAGRGGSEGGRDGGRERGEVVRGNYRLIHLVPYGSMEVDSVLNTHYDWKSILNYDFYRYINVVDFIFSQNCPRCFHLIVSPKTLFWYCSLWLMRCSRHFISLRWPYTLSGTPLIKPDQVKWEWDRSLIYYLSLFSLFLVSTIPFPGPEVYGEFTPLLDIKKFS